MYALYHGDTIITIGTKQELADYLGVKPDTIKFYNSTYHKNRTNYSGYYVIKIEEDKDVRN